ncbi:head GIN domain-containing protein [Sediminitomix flava]|uniref:Uncharacterized protein n=1 Tax=Sediminitomix flava TaxID=379075 RepID=A0A315Z9K8_SEDFL|nr:DUF2807 domain-containing protein [Sediminitomix flava]PWJ41962.1 hypothetical protein BC781_103212 [Sediminitomix flava]
MKKSNILLITLFSSFPLLFLSVIFQAWASFDEEITMYETHQTTIPSFSHIHLDEVGKLKFETAENYGLEIKLGRGITDTVEVPYEVKNDTLFISKLSEEEKNKVMWITVSLPNENLSISADASIFEIGQFKGDAIAVNLNHSHFNQFSRHNEISNLSIEAKDRSTVDIYAKYQQADFKLNNSKMSVEGPVNEVNLELENKASVNLYGKAGKTQILKDATSELRVY